MNDYTIWPLFSSVVLSTIITENIDKEVQQIINTQNFVSTNNSPNTFISDNYRVLDKYQNIRQIIKDIFYDFKDNTLEYRDTDFDIVTSWVTKTTRDGTSLMHCHKNSFYSGVLYFDEIENGAPIEFSNQNLSNSFMLNPASSYNIFNSETWRVYPRKNEVILFPSHLYHRVYNHQSDNIRYSLAFNILPIGMIGEADSRILFTAR